MGGVGDDSNNVWEGGGSCITQEAAAEKLAADPAGLAEMMIELSSDNRLASFSTDGAVTSHIRSDCTLQSAARYLQMCMSVS